MMQTKRSKAQTLAWEARQWSGMEYLRLEQRPAEIVAEGTILMIENDHPLRIGYTIRCDPHWTVRQVAIHAEGADNAEQQLQADGAGHWSSASGGPLASLDGCIDVDIAATPFTNTLPIRRLALKPGDSAEIKVAYIAIPDLSVNPARQRYTCLEARPDGARYRYESLDSGFTAELRVDADGLVIDYQELWRRLWPR